MILYRLLGISICLFTALSVAATPISSGWTERPIARSISGRDTIPLQDAVSQFAANVSTIRTNLGEYIVSKNGGIIVVLTELWIHRSTGANPDTIGSTNVSTIDTAKKATDDLKASYDYFRANLEELKAKKKTQVNVEERGFPFGSCGVVKDIGGIIKDVLVIVDFIKSAIAGEPTDATDIIAVVFATLSVIVQGVPSLIGLALSVCSPF